MGRSQGGLSTKVHVRADAKGRPLAFALTGGEARDLTRAGELLALWDRLPRSLLADKGYDADRLREDLLLSEPVRKVGLGHQVRGKARTGASLNDD